MPFFQNAEIKSTLTELLILWSGKNGDTQYHQGMNEIAALVIMIFSQEKVANPYPNATDQELCES